MVPVNTKGNNDFYSWHDILYTACLAKCFIVTEEALNTWSHRHFISALRTQLFLRRASAPREKQKSGLSVTALGFFYFLTYPFCMCVCVCLLVCVCVCAQGGERGTGSLELEFQLVQLRAVWCECW